MIKRALVMMVSLIAALLVAVPTAGAQELPEDCAVPPDIDLSQYNVIIGTNASETLVGTEGDVLTPFVYRVPIGSLHECLEPTSPARHGSRGE